ncbi:hypothetical protein BGX26_002414, partial [Mortierella sp. AD094]
MNDGSNSSVSDEDESWELSLPITRGIKQILAQYPEGSQIARELLQNSDDAQSTVQWFLLDHRSHSFMNANDAGIESAPRSKLTHPRLKEYMGPALIAGNDSVFKKKDFESLSTIGESVKAEDIMKIGQMGVGFNSVYHMTDCPSFISGSQIAFLDPHSYMLSTAHKEDFVKKDGVTQYPDLLSSFAALEDIDFSQPYQGTMFRFPLRTESQAKKSKISGNACSVQMIKDMLMMLKEEALQCLLFLKHVERIVIYERHEGDSKPVKLFEAAIVNSSDVREQRGIFLSKLKDHLNPQPSDAGRADLQPPSGTEHSSTLDYTIWPQFKLTHQDGTVTFQTWMTTGMVESPVKSREHMAHHGIDTAKHRMIPWVAVASPVSQDVKFDSRLFCFLPTTIQLPFPVHIHGHFAVTQNRRQIWSDQVKDLTNRSDARTKSLWNAYLINHEIPRVYAKFLHNMGLAHGANYSLWPTASIGNVGDDAIWGNLLRNLLKEALASDSYVFFCRAGRKSEAVEENEPRGGNEPGVENEADDEHDQT